jgi:hypothetical protein
MAEPVRALSVRQPYAGAIIWMGKDVENRSQRMSYRGPLLIHASLYEPDAGDFLLVRNTATVPVRWDDARRTRGAILGVVEVAGCHHAADCGGEDRQDGRRLRWRCCSPWGMRHQWHIALRDPRPLPEPVPCRGKLGLWRLPDEVEKAVREQLSEVARG